MNQEMEEMLEQMDSSRYLQNMDAAEMHFIENLDMSAFQPPEENNFDSNIYAIPIDLMGSNQDQFVFVDEAPSKLQALPRKIQKSAIVNSTKFDLAEIQELEDKNRELDQFDFEDDQEMVMQN